MVQVMANGRQHQDATVPAAKQDMQTAMENDIVHLEERERERERERDGGGGGVRRG